MEYKDYYEILGISRDASSEEIRKKYKKLAREYHPDVSEEEDAEARFAEISEAYEVLGDEEKRQKYDQFGHAWKQAQQEGGQPPPGWEHVHFGGPGGGFTVEGFEDLGDTGFSSFFEMLFGARDAGGRGGFGGFPGGAGGRRTRRTGEGGARRAQWAQRGADQEAEIRLTLEEAARGGTRSITLTDPSTGERQTLKVKIPRGVRPGQKIRLAGKGTPGAGGGPPGDLYLTVDVAPHPRFRLEDRNLRVEIPVAPWEAALGGEAEVPTLDGTARVKIPAGTSSGQRIRLRGHGFPDPRGSDGDLFAEVKIVVPKPLTERQRELYEGLREEHRTVEAR